MTEFVTPQLRTVLKTYQSSATKSLQGPGLSLAQHHHHHHHQQQQQQQQQQHHHHHQQQHHHQHKKDNQHHHHQQQQQQHNNHHHNNHHHNTTSSTSSDDDLTNNNDDIDTIIQYIQPPELTQPIISAADTGRGVLYETILEKKPIGCFLLGGEMRLCLPQFLNNVLTDFTLEQINRIFDELRIFCSQCTPEQLNEFKQAKILPNDCKQSGLITKTNAERLCSALLHNNNNNHHHQQQQHHQHQQQHNNQNNLRILNKPLLIHNNIITTTTINPNNLNNGTTTITTTTTAAASSTNNNTNANTNDNTNTNSTIATTTTIKNNTNNTNNLIKFKIIHRCFGKCEGICIPELYKYNESLCIECIECNLLFSPKKFVLHVHRQNEIQTCHWGFDSNNWRSYIHISTNDNNLNSKENLNYDKYRKILDELKEREKYEDPDTINMILLQRDVTTTNLKRKAVIEESHIQMPTCKTEPLDIPLKKTKLIDDTYNLIEYHQYQQALLYAQAQFRQQQQQMSAFRPWAQITPKHLPHLPYTAGLPYLSQEPPILQNPERVVKLEECERFERSFQPNVALAPRRHHNNNNNNNNNLNNNNNNNNNLNNNNNNFIIKERDRDRTRLHATTTTSLTTSATTGTTLTASTTITTAKTTALTTTTTSLTTTTLSSSSSVIGGIGGSGNVNETGIGLTTAAIGTTTDIIQIKQERPSTPPDEILSNSPELRVTQSPIEQSQFSPEAFSGSNEITSSTSPVLTLKSGDTLLNSPLHQISVPMENLHHHNHHHNHINNNNHHHHYHNNNNNNNLINNNNHRIQQSPIMLKNCSNAIMGNPEFELSTDTDDDSMTGEPDSSNTNVPLELAADILKDVRPDDKDKVLNIIKMLLHENVQLRHFSMENQEELRRKDEQINELLRQQQHFEQQQRRHQIPLSPVEPSVIAKPENNIDNIVIDRSYRTEKLEVIMKPLKKSLLRRSPEETVVVLQQTKREDNIDQSKDSITRINLDLITDKVKDIPLIKNTDSG